MNKKEILLALSVAIVIFLLAGALGWSVGHTTGIDPFLRENALALNPSQQIIDYAKAEKKLFWVFGCLGCLWLSPIFIFTYIAVEKFKSKPLIWKAIGTILFCVAWSFIAFLVFIGFAVCCGLLNL